MTVGYDSMPWTSGRGAAHHRTVKYRLFGASGLRVSELFLGTMTFGEDWGWGAPPEECRRIFDAYAEAGGNVIDTAVNYTDGASERIVGELLGSQRDHFVVSTKFTLSTDPADPNASGSHRKNLVRSLDSSLRRLGTDRIDIYWVHIWDPNTPIEETMRALDDAVRAGKVLYIGVSDTPAWVIARANTLADWRGWSPPIAIQVPYSLIQRDIERELLPMAESAAMSLAAWSPLAGGILSGKFTRGDVAGRVESPPARSANATSPSPVPSTTSPTTSASPRRRWRSRGRWHAARRCIPSSAPGGSTSSSTTSLPSTANSTAESLRRLDDASAISLGFPHDFIRDTAGFVYGTAGERVLPRRSRP